MDRATTGPRVKRLGCYLFAGALLADLVLIATGASDLRIFSKSLLVPALMIYFAANVPARGAAPQRWILPALLFSWIGDVLLLFEERAPLFFMLGLSSFLVAHLFYCGYFAGIWKKEKIRMHLPFLLGVLVYFAGLLLLLWPGLGALKIPVLVYGAVISAMLLLALHTVLSRRRQAVSLLMPGAMLFVVSDSLLATNRFLTPLPLAGIAVMLTYGLAQLLLTEGALRYAAQKQQQPGKVLVS